MKIYQLFSTLIFINERIIWTKCNSLAHATLSSKYAEDQLELKRPKNKYNDTESLKNEKNIKNGSPSSEKLRIKNVETGLDINYKWINENKTKYPENEIWEELKERMKRFTKFIKNNLMSIQSLNETFSSKILNTDHFNNNSLIVENSTDVFSPNNDKKLINKADSATGRHVINNRLNNGYGDDITNSVLKLKPKKEKEQFNSFETKVKRRNVRGINIKKKDEEKAFEYLRNKTNSLEPLIDEIIKTGNNETFKHLPHTKAPVHTINIKIDPWKDHVTTFDGFILLGGDEDDINATKSADDDDGGGNDDDEGGDDGEFSETSSDEHAGSGKYTTGAPGSSEKIKDKSKLTQTTAITPFIYTDDKLGFEIFTEENTVQPTKKSQQKKISSIPRPTNTPAKIKQILHSTTARQTTKMTNSKYEEKGTYLDIGYYGPCLFCKEENEIKLKRKSRKNFRKNILRFDFVILTQKHHSGILSSILSLHKGKISFPKYNFIRLHVPLTCGCFVQAKNQRYILAGKNVAGKFILNNVHPLYEVEDYTQLTQIQLAMRIKA